jgi:ATP-binding cassette subfamily C (CFTR/MRP) protein 1
LVLSDEVLIRQHLFLQATSSIDLETDEAIQRILRGPAFDHVTKLIIAHRMNTIEDSDRILVLDHGRVAEYDSPQALLEKPDSLYASLVGQARKGGLD